MSEIVNLVNPDETIEAARKLQSRPEHKNCPLCRRPQTLKGTPKVYYHDDTNKLACK